MREMVLNPDSFCCGNDQISFFDIVFSLAQVFVDFLLYFSKLCPIIVPKKNIIFIHYF